MGWLILNLLCFLFNFWATRDSLKRNQQGMAIFFGFCCGVSGFMGLLLLFQKIGL